MTNDPVQEQEIDLSFFTNFLPDGNGSLLLLFWHWLLLLFMFI